MQTRALLQRVHRILSLTVVLVWLLQAISGCLLVFKWELDDLRLGSGTAPLDVRAFADSIDALRRQRPQDELAGIYSSGGVADRFDILFDTPAGTDWVRVDGAGRVLRQGPFDHDYAKAGLFRIAGTLHETLFFGARGQVLIGLSGILLATNLLLALRMTWPRRGQWRAALQPWRGAPNLYRWHRALGLWFAAPLLVMSVTGALTAFGDEVEHAFDAALPTPSLPLPEANGATPPDLAAAIETARARYPQAAVTSILLPSESAPWFRVRLRQRGEIPRVFGTTTIYVDARDGAVLLDQDSRAEPIATKALGAVLPLHTGEALGLPGRAFVQLLPFGFVTLMVLGVTQWWKRRRRR